MKYVLLFLVTLSFVGCGTSREAWTNQHCSEAGGYEMGQKDARAKRTFTIEALQKKCPSDKGDLAIKGYMDGFKTAGGKIPPPEEYQYGGDIFKDAIYAINKPGKKKEDKTQEAAKKTDDKTKEEAKTEEAKPADGAKK